MKIPNCQGSTSLNVGGSELGWPAVLTTSYSHCPGCGERLTHGHCLACSWPNAATILSDNSPFSAQIPDDACLHCFGSRVIVPLLGIECAWCGGTGKEAKR